VSSKVAVCEVRTAVIFPVGLKPCRNTWIEKFSGVAARPFKSLTSTVIGKDPVVLGVPDRSPSAANLRPGASVPVSLHVSGRTPLFAVKVKP